MVLINREVEVGDVQRRLKATVASWMGDAPSTSSSLPSEPVARPARAGVGAVTVLSTSSAAVPEHLAARLTGKRRGGGKATQRPSAAAEERADEEGEEEEGGKSSLLLHHRHRKTVEELKREEEAERERKRSRRKRKQQPAGSEEAAATSTADDAIDSSSEVQAASQQRVEVEEVKAAGTEHSVAPVDEHSDKAPVKKTRQVPITCSARLLWPVRALSADRRCGAVPRCVLRCVGPGAGVRSVRAGEGEAAEEAEPTEEHSEGHSPAPPPPPVPDRLPQTQRPTAASPRSRRQQLRCYIDGWRPERSEMAALYATLVLRVLSSAAALKSREVCDTFGVAPAAASYPDSAARPRDRRVDSTAPPPIVAPSRALNCCGCRRSAWHGSTARVSERSWTASVRLEEPFDSTPSCALLSSPSPTRA